jgi:hypothetical protein
MQDRGEKCMQVYCNQEQKPTVRDLFPVVFFWQFHETGYDAESPHAYKHMKLAEPFSYKS